MRIITWSAALLTVVGFSLSAAPGAEPAAKPKTRNVVLVTTDGLRWQEVFRGAEKSLLNKENGGVAAKDLEPLKREFWRDAADDRREALMPFLWSTVARDGQIYGNADRGSPAKVTNGMNFSYPGYNEMLTASPDPRIDSNAKRPNPNVSVLEWLNRKPDYRGKVVAVGSWDVYPSILNAERSGLTINAGWEPFAGATLTPAQVELNRMMAQTPRTWPECRNDAFTFQVALEHLRRDRPRVLYIGLGDTDEHAHAGRYDLYLKAARNADADLKLLWDELQSMPDYKGSTTLIITTDHGRGDPPQNWRHHGAKIPGSESIWLALLGPDTPALGERSEVDLVTQGQVASTIAALLGEDFHADAPKSAPPIAGAVGSSASK